MWKISKGFASFTLFLVFTSNVLCLNRDGLVGTNVNLGDALQFLREFDSEASRICFRVRSAQWNYSTNMTDHNKRKMIEEQTLQAKFNKLSWQKAATFDWPHLPDPIVRSQLKTLLALNTRASLNDDKYNEIYYLISEMKDIYSHLKVCPFSNPEKFYCDLELGDVERITGNSRNSLELLHVWREWHDQIGPPIKNKFMRYVEIANYASRINGFANAGEEMRLVYGVNFEQELHNTWKHLQPLYKELFTYVRRKLLQYYGPASIREEGPLPAHLLGNLWAQDWSKIIDIVAPFPATAQLDITDEMLRQNVTPLRIFQLAEEFFTSLGLKPMPPEFWRFSMLEQPTDRRVQCTSSAWDFCNRLDYRIKQCTQMNQDALVTTHHEMAHIQYYLSYAEQPYLYRDGANPGFHEGVANAISLCVYNPTHFHRIGLFYGKLDSYEANMNFLMVMALRKVAFAPFALLVDMWRYQIFRDGVQNMNALWWEFRLRYQGIIPPVPRTENHFDAAAKKHIAADKPYLPYYITLLLEFQLFQALCEAAGHRGHLHTCDIYRSKEAGRILMDLMKVGKSRDWQDVIKMLTRGRSEKLSVQPMLDYFQPLLLWLQVQNRNESVVGRTTSVQDEALFQPLVFGKSSSITALNALLFLSCFILIIK